MKKVIVVCGHGPGISDAVARRFGREGFSAALVARSAARLAESASALGQAGIEAKDFPCDLGDPESVRALVRDVRSQLGPVTALHWNAYGGGGGDLLTARPAELQAALGVSVLGMVAAVQEALPDLKAQKGGLLVTGGGLGYFDPKVDAIAVQWQAMGLAIAKAAQHKTVGLLRERLAAEEVYVGEVVVLASVKGTAFDSGQATLEASAVADRFWQLYAERKESSVNIS